MIELTHEQRQQLDAGGAVDVTDTQTAGAYVVLRKDVYERVKALVYDDSEWTHEEMRAHLARNLDTIWDGPGMDDYDRYDEERRQAMPVSRGDVVLAYVPFVGTAGGKVRPALVVQSNHNNSRLNETIVAAITTNVSRTHEPTQLLIEIATPDGAASGLLHDSVVRCERLQSLPQSDVRRTIGRLSPALLLLIDDCLKAALGIA